MFFEFIVPRTIEPPINI